MNWVGKFAVLLYIVSRLIAADDALCAHTARRISGVADHLDRTTVRVAAEQNQITALALCDEMDAHGKLYLDHKEKLFAYLIRLTGDYETARDVLQESFTRYLERYRKKPVTISLLYTIARNAYFDEVRKRRITTDQVDERSDPGRNPEERTMIRQAYRRVVGAMQTLPEAERDILSLVVGGDLTYKEIARIIGISEANVKVKVHRARTKLRGIMQKA